MSRRELLAMPVAFVLQHDQPGAAAVGFERRIIARAILQQELVPPLTVGLARIILRSGATAWAETPGGVRILYIESGALEVETSTRDDARQFLATGVGMMSAPRETRDLVLRSGTAMPFGSVSIASIRNSGKRSVVLLDAAVYSEEPRPMARAFTSDDGLSFQLLAHASLAAVPSTPAAVTLERLRLGPGAAMPSWISTGCALIYLESGGVVLTGLIGEVAYARAAAAAPYALPGTLRAVALGDQQPVTAGGVIALALDSSATIHNASTRTASFLMLAIRVMP
jgi:hypothetical protein